MKPGLRTDQFLYGVCYFPEHWDRSQWRSDLEEMKAMGMNVVRMGEGAWSVWESEEGHYSFALFDEVIEICAALDLQVILGTPTYAPPAWLTEKYPEVLRKDFRGNVMHHGSRRHYNYTAPKFMELCRGVVTALARHYGNNPTVIGWQIDNEFNCHMDVSFAESDEKAFRHWCVERYGSLDVLNEAWGNVFWSQTYSSWEQVTLPKPTPTYHNPSHLLDFYRFISHTVIEFSKLQYQILRRWAPRQFVTHNGLFDNYDAAALTEEGMDFMSYDSYPAFQAMFAPQGTKFRERMAGMGLARTRGLSDKFLVLEQQAGPGGQAGGNLVGVSNYLHVTPKPGQMRLWAWQSAAHGADGVLFFRWRTCPFGSEMLWHGLHHYGGQDQRRLQEAEQLGNEFQQVGVCLTKTKVHSPIAVLYDYDNDSNAKIDGYLTDAVRSSGRALYQALQERHLGVDYLPLAGLVEMDELLRYPFVFYPNAQLLSEEDAAVLRGYAAAGGTLILGPRSGYKDRRNQCFQQPFPGVVRELTGIEVKDFTMVDPHGELVQLEFGDTLVSAPAFHEVLEMQHGQARALARYSGEYYAGEAAVVQTPVGQGRVIYCGSYFAVDTAHALLDTLGASDPCSGWAEIPDGVEVIVRQTDDERFYILLNHDSKPAAVHLYQMVAEMLSGESLVDEVLLEPFGVWLLRRS